MARTVKQQEYANKRNDILAAAQRLVYTKGYELMTIQDIQADLGISSGAFYHYFESKQALLEALVERSAFAAQQTLHPILQDPQLSALQKFRAYFEASLQWKSTQKSLIFSLMRMWYADENAIVRQKMTSESLKYTPRLFEPIIRQGIEEKVFNTRYPEQVAVILAGLALILSDQLVALILVPQPQQTALQKAETILAAYFDTVERILGAPAGSLKAFDMGSFKDWFSEIQAEPA